MKTKLGTSIIILSLIISLNPYFIIIAIPIYLVGLMFLYRSDKSQESKILWAIIPILIWYPLFQLLIYTTDKIGMANAQKIEFRFASNFEGKVVILSGVPCGEKIKLENGREVLNIPQNGFFVYSNEIEIGYINHIYSIKKEDGQYKRLPELKSSTFNIQSKNNNKRDLKGIFHSYKNEKSTRNFFDKSISYRETHFNVCSFDQLKQFESNKMIKTYEKKADSIILNCLYKLVEID